ncbi:Membrane-bound lytic murein transglycosylase F (EC 4.2.2.n1) [hydrothermal vent metagenome]|uniref:Membrane-bound lytic murein transglycosylase F n=1 Tax=hydrothermal vent metagenome TaxID=652676 RepID=A0A3B0W6B3_9ZZZZ
MVVASIIFIFNYLPKFGNATLVEQIKSDGQLIVATRNSPTTYYEGVDDPAGLEYEMAKMFADELGVELTLLLPESFDDLLDQVYNNQVHIAAAGLTVTKDREKIFQFGPAYQEITEQLVYNVANQRPRNLATIDGTLEVVANSSHEERLKYLTGIVTDLSWKSNHQLESEELLQMVSDDIIEYTIADSNELLLNQRFLINLRVAFDISEPQLLAWAMPKKNDKSLLREVEKFFKKIKANGELTRLIERNYGHVENFDYVGTRIFMRHIETRLPAYQDFFEEAAAEQGLDWRLIAAMGYQESHWNPDAVSKTGVRGIMMLTLKTANDMNIKNRLDPKSSIFGGTLYFKKTLDRIDEAITEPDNIWMAMAAYNVGFYHVQDARKITRKLNGNPNRWIDVRQSLPLLAKREWYKKTQFGYARGWEPVRYVGNIRSYYDILKWVDNSNNEATSVPEEFLKIPNSL